MYLKRMDSRMFKSDQGGRRVPEVVQPRWTINSVNKCVVGPMRPDWPNKPSIMTTFSRRRNFCPGCWRLIMRSYIWTLSR